MSRAPLAVAAVLAIVAGSGTPVCDWQLPVSAEVDGLGALTHRPLLFMSAGPGPFGHQDPCADAVFALYEDGLVIYTTTTNGCPTLEAHVGRAFARDFAELVVSGLRIVPHKQWLTTCTDQGGVSITARRGTRWYRTEVDGLDRFGNVTCQANDDDQPHPNTLAILRMFASFHAAGAVPWVAGEFAIELSPGAYHPAEQLKGAVPWPDDLPPPNVNPNAIHQTADYDAKYLPAAKRVISPLGNSFVTLGDRTWAYYVRTAVLPERAYLAQVGIALSRAEQALPRR